MVRLMVVTFAFLAWAFWELSGGADFDPDQALLASASTDPLKSTGTASSEAGDDIEVSRVSLDLTSVDDVLAATNATRVSSRLPQNQAQRIVPEDETVALVETIPSLIENAVPENVLSVSQEVTADSDRLTLDTGGDFRVIDGNRVNVRGGPGTSYGIVDTLTRGQRVEVLDDTGTGWVRMRVSESGTMGWIADFLLTDG